MATALNSILAGLGTTKQAVTNSLNWFRGIASSLRGTPQRSQQRRSRTGNPRSPFALVAARYVDPVTPFRSMNFFDMMPLLLPLGTRQVKGHVIRSAINVHYLTGKTREPFFNMLRMLQEPTTGANRRATLIQNMITLAATVRPSAIRNYRETHFANWIIVPTEETSQAANLYVPQFHRNPNR
jgi:hypothetical protein